VHPSLAPLRRLLPLLFFGLGLWVLHGQLGAQSYRGILDALQAVPGWALLAAGLLTVLNFVVLGGYDALGVRYAGRPLPVRRTALASFLGFSFSQALGFPLLTGAPLRFRLYTGWGLSAPEVARVVGFSTLTFWLGLATLAGGILVLAPGTAGGALGVPAGAVLPVGVLLLALPAAWVGWATFVRRPLARGYPAPAPAMASGQVVVGTLDWLLSASVLWVLLPAGHGMAVPLFLGIYLAAQLAGLLSHVPGGLGVFEAVVLLALPPEVAVEAAVASLLVFRIVLYFSPLLVGATLLGVYEVVERRGEMERAVGVVGRGASAAAPLLLSAAVFTVGALLLISGSVPVPAGRLEWLARVLPLEVIEVSHFAGSVVGTLLMVGAFGLYRRLDVAWKGCVVLVVAGLLLSATRGGMGLHLTGGILGLVALAGTRHEFYRRGGLVAEPLGGGWAALLVLVLVTTGWVALLVHDQDAVAAEAWWRFTLSGDAPRALRATVGAGTLLLLFGGMRLLGPGRGGVDSPGVPSAVPEPVVQVVRRAPRAYANLALLGDKRFLMAPEGDAFLMYAVEGRAWVAMGDPVGEESRYPALLWRFREEADRHAGWPVIYQAAPRHLPLYVDLGLALVKVGETGRVPLADFSLEGGRRASFRKSVRKLDAEGFTFEVVPEAGVPPLLPELRRISDAWLGARNTREKRFSLGRFSDDYLARNPVAVVRATALEGAPVVAFANLWASPEAEAREEFTVDLMRHTDQAPPGVMDFLFVRLMLWGREEGYLHFSMGMAPLGGLDDRPLAPLWNRVGSAIYRHGEHFYNFRGLRAYKDKYDPVWEPRYLAAPGGTVFPRALASVATLIAGGVRGVVAR
jgi:phosphatidylglycerol lysyltransferase